MLIAIALLYFITTSSVAQECSEERRSQDKSWERKLFKDLIDPRRTDVRPVLNQTDYVAVKLLMNLNYFQFDSSEESFTIHIHFVLTWKDECIVWNPTDYGGIEDVVVRSYDIWTPELSLLNADDYFYLPQLLYLQCIITSNGTVSCLPQLSYTTVCATSLTDWPYDTQTCSFKFGNKDPKKQMINIKLLNLPYEYLNEKPQGCGWDLLNTVTKIGQYRKDSEYENVIEYVFELKRQGAGLAAMVIIPSIVLGILTLTSLILNVNGYVRIGILMFSLMLHLVLVSQISFYIPKYDFDPPKLLLYLRNSMFLTAIAFVVTLTLIWLRSRTVKTPVLLVTLKDFVNNSPGKYLVMTKVESIFNNLDDDELQANVNWITLANILNSLCIIIFVIIYLVIIIFYIPFK